MYAEPVRRRRRGGNWWDALDPNKNGVAQAFQPQAIQAAFAPLTNEFTNANSVLRSDLLPKLQNEVMNQDSILRAQIIPAVQTAAALAGYGRRGKRGRGRSGGAWFDDLGQYAQTATKQFTDPNSFLRKVHHEYVDPNSYTHQGIRGAQQAAKMFGFGRMRRHFPGDGRSQRGVIVRQVMQQHPGMSLPQASRYVKEHNLY